ncbi:MAG: MotA/TolQ/ExbB proton channel family protein [Acidobacteria bacterium]|jgi:biopolymer transport protein ExbB|nr:MotA/TolQ/ExbB proton channel family protein [Acidobacteriota bacterium]
MQNILGFLSKGGIIMYPLFLCSIAALAVAIEKAVSLRRRKIIIPEVVAVLENVKETNDFGLAVSICEKHHGPLANVIRISLENHGLPREELKEALLDQGRQEVHQLERGLGVLETVAGIAPLLGLLGTVLGILKVFKVIADLGVGQAAALAGGISEALITTIAGLFIGIPALVAYNYFAHKAEALVLEIEKYSNRLLARIGAIHGAPRS